MTFSERSNSPLFYFLHKKLNIDSLSDFIRDFNNHSLKYEKLSENVDLDFS